MTTMLNWADIYMNWNDLLAPLSDWNLGWIIFNLLYN